MRIVAMVSGNGSNLQAILDAIEIQALAAEVVLVVSNRRAAYALQRAAQAGVPTLYFPLKLYRDQGLDRAQYDADLAAEIRAYRPDLIVLVGWMHVLSPAFLDQFPGRVINLHPALPGMFDGVEAIQRAYEAYQRGEITCTGCMVHVVIPQIDAGEVIAQTIVVFQAEETLEAFEARMHAAEHRLTVEAIQRLAVRDRTAAHCHDAEPDLGVGVRTLATGMHPR
jgi:formyltetrahydrofolate-dependent phosphoribosylglycinamide formyltransferase